MCGIAGFSLNKNHDSIKLQLTAALGRAIDSRGGHGCGFVSIKDNETHAVKSLNEWKHAPIDFVLEAANSDTLLMHSRYATCGDRDQAKQAHPFAIKRKGKTVLYGVHNGIIWDAWRSAHYYGREIDVDSQELFELIADEKWRTLRILEGYGIAMWVEAGAAYVNLARLSSHSEICVIEVEGGGFVWGSTWPIVSYALKIAKLKPIYAHVCKQVGQVYHIHQNGIVASNKLTNVKVSCPFDR